MISGAGMLDFLVCQSAEKLVIDAEAIAMAQRLLRGIGTPTETLATAMFAQTGLKGEFLKLKDTRRLFPVSSICRRRSSIAVRCGRGKRMAASMRLDARSNAWLNCSTPINVRSWLRMLSESYSPLCGVKPKPLVWRNCPVLPE